MPKTTKKTIKRRLIMGGLVLLFILVAGGLTLPYLIPYVVSPELLIRNTTRALEDLTGADIEIGQAQLSVLKGVTFHDVRVLLPKDKQRLEPAFSPEDALLLQAKTFNIKLRRKGLLGLDFGLKKISVETPELHLTRLQSTNRWNWQLLLTRTASAPATQRSLNIGPPIFLRNGKVLLTEIQNDGRRSLDKIHFDAQARAYNHKAFYRIDLQTRSNQTAGPNLSIDFDHHKGHILSGHLDPIRLTDLQTTLPAPFKDWLNQLNASGTIALTEIRYAPPSPTRVVLTLNNVCSKIPTSPQEFQLDAPAALFNLAGLNGSIVLDNTTIHLADLEGRLNDAACRIEGTIPLTRTPADAAFELQLACTGFDFPNYTDPDTQTYIDTLLPWRLQHFFDHFKPIGRADIDLTFRRTPEQPPGFRLNGRITPQQCSAEYFKFPYRVDDITGSVDLIDNRFQLNRLTGSTGRGTVVVSGTVSDPSKYAETTLVIDSTQTPIDDKLLQALHPRDQKIFNQFNPAGFADTHIELYNPPGFGKPWTTAIDAKLFDTSARYDRFPYPISHLQGHLSIKNKKLELTNISGRHQAGKFTLNGSVENPKARHPIIQIDLTANDVPIDDTLTDALPANTRQIVHNFRLTGTTDIEGSLRQHNDSPLSYTFHCQLKKADLQPREFPYPLKDLDGRLTLTPHTVTIHDLHTENDDQNLTAQGRVDFRDGQSETTLTLSARRLPLDTTLFNALPPTVQTIWTPLNPQGKIDVKANVHLKPDQPWSGSVKLNLIDVVARYKTLDPLTALWGQINITPNQTDLQNITGKLNADAPFWLDGVITHTPQTRRVTLTKLEVRNAPVRQGLLETLVGQTVTDRFQWTPGGTADCLLTRVQTDLLSNTTQKWALAGRLNFHDVHMAAFNEAPTALSYTGEITSLSPKGGFALDGDLKLTSLNWHGRQVDNIQARLKKPLNSVLLTVDPLTGQFAGGQVSGMAKLTFLGKDPQYGLQLTLDNLDAARALRSNETNNGINGRMKGELYLKGTVGQKYSQLGGGILQITGAEVFKVPLMARIYEKLKHEPPNLATFHNVTARFALEKYKVRFEHIDLTGPTLTLVGSGDLNISNDRLNLDLVTASPKSLKHIPVLPELMQGASGELSQIEVHGSTHAPTITVRPLKNISETLKTFFNGKTVH